mmetsp:Transcript_10848/g.15675  ORF Transcript_10848/g.15675 Transcript_10848/m.15675 type:complete len:110 (+) Transcript_10848:1514-1843(+)
MRGARLTTAASQLLTPACRRNGAFGWPNLQHFDNTPVALESKDNNAWGNLDFSGLSNSNAFVISKKVSASELCSHPSYLTPMIFTSRKDDAKIPAAVNGSESSIFLKDN